jgi:hypothetical protein
MIPNPKQDSNQDPIEELVDELYAFHGLKTETEREVLREMVVATFMEEIYTLAAEKICGKCPADSKN